MHTGDIESQHTNGGAATNFPKKYVSPKEELSVQGSSASQLARTFDAAVNAPTTSICSASVNYSHSSTSSSLLVGIPVKQAVVPPSPTSQTELEEIQDEGSCLCFLKKLVALFAGKRHKKTPSTYHKHSSSAPILASDQPRLAGYATLEDIPYAPTNQPEVLSKYSPRLLLPKTIPSVAVPGKECVNNLPTRISVPPAPVHELHGAAIVAPDIFVPEIVQRDFCFACDSSTSSDNSRIESRCHNLDARLLDRAGDVWTQWHSQNPKGLY